MGLLYLLSFCFCIDVVNNYTRNHDSECQYYIMNVFGCSLIHQFISFDCFQNN